MAGRMLFLDTSSRLEPSDAVAAIMLDESGQYLMQHRDAKANIFYPDHWGCFGGALEAGEQPVSALQRELREELELDVKPAQVRPFTRFEFDFNPIGKGKVMRLYFEVRISWQQAGALRLHEGQAVGRFAAAEILDGCRVTPYDAFAVWMHYQAVARSVHTAKAR